MKMCIVPNSFRKPKCDETEYFPSDSLNVFKKFALANDKSDVLHKYERLRKQDSKYDIGENPYVYLIGNEWHLSRSDKEDQLEELDDEETTRVENAMRNKAIGYPSPNMTTTSPNDEKDEFGGARKRPRFTRRKNRKTVARKSRRSKHLNKKRQKKSRRKSRMR
jgi:hypothetical protein